MPESKIYDLFVIGGGPAGMMAAITSAQHGLSVRLADKNDIVGKKLLLTGGGRCNLSHTGTPEEMIEHIPHSGKSMYKAFYRFHSPELIRFFAQLGVPIKADASGKYFPVTQQAREVQVVLSKALKLFGVETGRNKIQTIEPIKDYFILHTSLEHFYAKNVLIATGGATYPGTGSSGDGYKFAERLGHTVYPIEPGLVPMESPLLASGELAGVSLAGVGLQCFSHSGKLKFMHKGDLLFTHDGVSGPLILDASLYVLEHDFPIEMVLTLPKEYEEIYPKRFQQFFSMTLADQDKSTHEPIVRFRCSQKKGWDYAMITLGGVSMQEINALTFESRLHKGVYFAGEVLDCHGRTGGYNLQIAFTTGAMVGEAVIRKIKTRP